MKLPMRLASLTVLVLSALGLTLVPVAQERTAASHRATGTAGSNETALLQKISYLTQLVKILDDQIKVHAAGEGITCPSVMPFTQFAPIANESTSSGSTHSMNTASSAPAAPAPTPAMPVRRSVSYQPASDSRLGCDDYSMSYFRRHPAMAAVCGVNAQQTAPVSVPVQQSSSTLPEEDDLNEPEAVPARAQ